ncbi:MAG: ATP-binding protein [Thermodesulfobacteriota bacterium]
MRPQRDITPPDELARLKPFRLVKFFSYTSLGFVMVTTIFLSWIISNHTKEVLLSRSQEYSKVFAKNLSHQIFQQFVLPLALQNRRIAIQDPRQFQKLDEIVKNATHGVELTSVTIFAMKENMVSYSTRPERIGLRDLGGNDYEAALAGESVSSYEIDGTLLNLLPGMDSAFCLLRTYIPLRKERPFSVDEAVMGVIEIEQDLSAEWQGLLKLQGSIIATLILIMSALFAVLSIIVARAELIIAARAEERRRLEDKLHQSERLASLGEMVASVSHEIKNPLGIVRSTAELLRKRIHKVAPGKEHLAQIIIDETIRLDGVVREFLDFARPPQLKLQEVAINDVVRRVTGFVKQDFSKNQVEVRLDLAQGLPWIKGDFDQLYQALLNVLVNGYQAMAEGGEIKVVTRGAGQGLVVEISDTGKGMGEEEKEQLFSPFYTSKTKGTGLGLAIVKKIIDSHGGAIEVASEEGEGTTFIIRLPAG